MKDKLFASDEQNEQQDQKKHIQNKPTDNTTHQKVTTKEANKLPSEHFPNIKQGAVFLNYYI
jgi:hypothetical protein